MWTIRVPLTQRSVGDREECSMYFKESQRDEAGPGGMTEQG